VLDMLSQRGVSVPLVDASDPTGDTAGSPCVLLRHVGGRPLRGSEPEFRAVGAQLRAVHDISLEGFGSLVVRGGNVSGVDRSWADTGRRRTTRLSPVVDAGLVAAELLDRAALAVDTWQELFTGVEVGHLLHGDFHPRHVFAAEGSITGIIDWGDATSGDPVYDLARVLHSGLLEQDIDHGFTLVRAALASYGDAAWTQGELTAKLFLYAVVFIMWSMQGEFAGGAPWAPWWPAQSRALSLLLDRLGSC
jgi:aminoglycoside phosphotransferase (APT) family kinase protein